MAAPSEVLAALRSRGEAALVAYSMAGAPDAARSDAALRGAAAGGADIIEVGFPFSDPLADGRVIQDAAAASLRARTTMASYLRAVSRLRARTDAPLAMMTYANVFESHGHARLARRAARAGIGALILPDMPVEESRAYARAAREAGVETAFLISPNTPRERVARIARASSAFVYLAGVYGTTGARRGGVERYTLDAIRAARRAAGRTPVGVGFGISSPRDVAACVRAGADAVIVGSAIVSLAARLPASRTERGVAALVSRLKAPTRRAPR